MNPTENPESLNSMNKELQSTLVSQINEAYAASISLADAAKGNARAAIEKAVECGNHLISAKAAVEHGNWAAWFRSHVTDFSIETAKRYIRLAEFVQGGGSLDDAAGMRQAFIAAGILMDSSRANPGKPSGVGSCAWLTAIQRTWDAIQKLDIREMAPIDRETLKARLKPYADKYAELDGAR